MTVSAIEERGSVTFPEFAAERIYMMPFRKNDGLPADLAHWQYTVDQMLDGIDTDRDMFLMIDQSVVPESGFQRRPGVHVDGWWVVEPGSEGMHYQHRIASHGTPSYTPSHRTPAPAPRPAHRTPSVPIHRTPAPAPSRHVMPSPSHRHGGGTHSLYPEGVDYPEAIVLASNVTGARAYVGEYDGMPREGGDCSHLDLSGLDTADLLSGRTWAGNAMMLHESLPLVPGTLRTLVRINVPGYDVT